MADIIKIALTGTMRSGKSEAMNYLERKYGYESAEFSEMLKYYADRVFSHTPEFNQRDEATGFGKRKNRGLHQSFGEKMCEIDPEVWVRHVAFSYEMALDKRSTTGFIVAGLRKPVEYDWLKAHGFTIIRINAPADVRKHRAQRARDLFTAKDFEHDTEKHVAGFQVDAEVYNGGRVEDMYAELDRIVKELQTKGGR